MPAALLTGLALVAALASLAHGDVLLVAAVMAVGGALLDVAAQLLGQRNAATALSPSQLVRRCPGLPEAGVSDCCSGAPLPLFACRPPFRPPQRAPSCSS